MKVGVLALQGGFAKHVERLSQLEVKTQLVKKRQDLEGCDGLILPGGESTVMKRLIHDFSLQEPLLEFAQEKPVFGTCAGLILLAHFGLMPITLERNAYGRQSASFTATLNVAQIGQLEALFIRAPQVRKLLSDKVEVLASFEKTPVLLKYGNRLGATFHPELTGSIDIHKLFLSML